jgi:membrane protein implicated in regulation of membrane protease activity
MMLAAYLAALGFGGTLIAVSLLLGGAMDKSLDKDLGGDHGDHGHHTDGWAPLLSLRFWTFGLAAFGLSGTALSLLSVPSGLVLALALMLGLSSGWSAARFFSALHRDQVSGATALERFVGEEGRVLLAVRADHAGKIAVNALGERVEMLARTRDELELEPGSAVIIVSVGSDGVADVSRIPSTHDGMGRTANRAPMAQAQRESG